MFYDEKREVSTVCVCAGCVCAGCVCVKGVCVSIFAHVFTL